VPIADFREIFVENRSSGGKLAEYYTISWEDWPIVPGFLEARLANGWIPGGIKAPFTNIH
jgi:hypothetical protein